MTVQEAIKEGGTEAQHLVYAWNHVQWMDATGEAKRKWLKEWGGLTGVAIPEWMVKDEALVPLKEVS